MDRIDLAHATTNVVLPVWLRVTALLVGVTLLMVYVYSQARLPTDQAWNGSACLGVGLNDILRGNASDPRVAWMVGATDGRRLELVWPRGYSATFAPALQVLDPSGRVVAHDGDKVIGGCPGQRPGDPVRVSSEGIRGPDWQPGEG